MAWILLFFIFILLTSLLALLRCIIHFFNLLLLFIFCKYPRRLYRRRLRSFSSLRTFILIIISIWHEFLFLPTTILNMFRLLFRFFLLRRRLVLLLLTSWLRNVLWFFYRLWFFEGTLFGWVVVIQGCIGLVIIWILLFGFIFLFNLLFWVSLIIMILILFFFLMILSSLLFIVFLLILEFIMIVRLLTLPVLFLLITFLMVLLSLPLFDMFMILIVSILILLMRFLLCTITLFPLILLPSSLLSGFVTWSFTIVIFIQAGLTTMIMLCRTTLVIFATCLLTLLRLYWGRFFFTFSCWFLAHLYFSRSVCCTMVLLAWFIFWLCLDRLMLGYFSCLLPGMLPVFVFFHLYFFYFLSLMSSFTIIIVLFDRFITILIVWIINSFFFILSLFFHILLFFCTLVLCFTFLLFLIIRVCFRALFRLFILYFYIDSWFNWLSLLNGTRMLAFLLLFWLLFWLYFPSILLVLHLFLDWNWTTFVMILRCLFDCIFVCLFLADFCITRSLIPMIALNIAFPVVSFNFESN